MINEEKLSYYMNKSKILDPKSSDRDLRVAILGSYTLNGIEEVLKVKCNELSVNASVYVADYNQYNQEILNSKSKLYNFNPDVVFLILDIRSILGDLFYFPYQINDSERKKFIEQKSTELQELLKIFSKNSNSKLIVTNFNIPVFSPYGIFENKMNFGLKKMVQELNNQLEDFIQTQNTIHLFDFDRFVKKHGEKNIFNYRQFFFGDVKLSIDYIPYFGNELIGYIKAILGLTKKCIVLDLDNTLWGGIVGEDGFDGIKLGPYSQGRPFLEFQKILLSLNQRGIILAINSKNNFDDAIKIIREHPHMILKEENFGCMKINWQDKVSNIREIAQELNIGLDSLVYFDDEPINREFVKSELPEIKTVNLSRDPSDYSPILTSLNDFDVLKITDDDRKRSNMYHQEKQRKDFQKSESNLENFLQKLNITVKLQDADNFTIPRISQLTLKTNQFNLTTKRYQEEEIKKFANDEHTIVGCAQVSDKFGDNGITGVYIIKTNNQEWIIDSFLLSCRIIGRGVEEGMLSHILEKAKQRGITKVKGQYIPTNKNQPCENFYADYGFKKNGNYWEFSLKNPIKTPKYLTLTLK